MATKKLHQSDLMMRAGAQGEAAVQRAHEGRTQSAGRRKGQEIQERQIDESTEQRNLDRWQRQWEQKRASDERTRQFDLTLEEKKRQFDVGGEQQEKQTKEGRQQQAKQFQEKQELTAATQGLQAAPDPREQARRNQAEAFFGDRSQKLRAEMERGKVQMDQPTEVGATGKWVQTPGAKQAGERAADLAQQKAQTDAYQAITSRRRLGWEQQKAQAMLDTKNTKEARAEVAKVMEKAQGPLDNWTNRMNRLEKSLDSLQPQKGLHQTDWKDIRELFGKTQGVGGATDLKNDIDAGEVTPRVMAWMAERQAKMGIQFIGDGTGVLPDSKYIDFLSDGWTQFAEQVQFAKREAGIESGGPGGLMETRTRQRQQRMAQKMAAKAILTGQLRGDGSSASGAGTTTGAGSQTQGQAKQDPDQAAGRTQEQQQQETTVQAAEQASRRPPDRSGDPSFRGVPGLGGDPGMM